MLLWSKEDQKNPKCFTRQIIFEFIYMSLLLKILRWYIGHGGPDCSECVEGWTSTADGFCIKLPDPFTLRQLHRIFTSSHNLRSSSIPRKGNPSYAYIGALILLVVFLVISIGVIVYIKFIKSSRNQHVSVVCNHEGMPIFFHEFLSFEDAKFSK